MSDPIIEVYEKFKHLDVVPMLSDPNWWDFKKPQERMAHEMWLAIKQYNLETKRADIKNIISEAEAFKCCPECGGDLPISDHYCEACKERISVPEDAYWFAQWLKKKYGVE